MSLTKKVMVLFAPNRYQELERVAKEQRCSVGALIRDAVEKEILEKRTATERTRLKSASLLISMREEVSDWDKEEELIARGHLG